jgi:energy-converting hydrogenase Eha subunit C
MDINLVSPLVSILSGIAILIWPRLLNYIVAFYLILFGLVELIPRL